MNQKVKILLYFFGIAIILGVFYTLASIYPMVGDDCTYCFIFPECQRIVNDFSDILESQKNHWYMCNGRFVVHFLVQAFLMFDRIYFSIANTLCYAVCCGVLARLITKESFIRNWLLILISYWLIVPSPAGTMFWLSGSFNYLWTSCLLLIFLYFVLSGNPRKEAVAIFIGLFAGNGHESMAFGVLTFLLACILVSPRKSSLFYIACTALFIGLCTSALAPATFVRLGSMGGGGVDGALPFIWKYVRNVMKVGYRLAFNWSDIGVQIGFLMWIASFIVWMNTKDKRDKNARILLCILVGTLGSLIPNIASGVTYVRSVYGFCFFSYISFIYILLLTKKAWVLNIFAAIMVCANIIIIPKAYDDIQILKASMEKVCHEVRQGKSLTSVNSECDTALPSRYACSPVSASVLFPANRCMATLLGVEHLSILKATEAAAVEKHYAEITNVLVHEKIDIDGHLMIARLQDKPETVISSIKRSSHIKPGDSLLTKAKDWIARQQGLRGDHINVIFINDGYYLFWVRGIINGTVRVSYSDGTSAIIDVD